ncbi:glycosyltransferase family 2 protein [Robertmurraya korlensis]|uniref:glycosyltransferase family 2 protein n=1 Tax=Robertmurraya korlensis TaxID=519977 RepID=UPI00203F5BAE|nr:glycosyltransferase family 2 protein [Robertmurraya korlensis]MCM3602226.1 glycosyltransferase family 2 protein [Robertmurraya korlensis]
MISNKVTVGIVTWNSSKFIRKCLELLNVQTYENMEVIIVDNNSKDDTVQIIEEVSPQARIIKSEENLGFCGGHNLAISLADGEYYMPYNPDIFAEENFIEEMVKAIQFDESIGSVSGKLLRCDPATLKKTNVIDSTGVFFQKNRRSLDRGGEEVDTGQYENMEYVFGASGAAPLYKKEALEDIKIGQEYFLEYFFAYREDVDLAWRLQHRGWKCIYTPQAIAYHVRNNTPLKRKEMSDLVNMHSVKNKIIMLLQNESKRGLMHDGHLYLSYEIMIFVYVLLKERTTLPAYKFIFKNWKKIMSNRQAIMTKSKVNAKEMHQWFGRINKIDIDTKIQ